MNREELLKNAKPILFNTEMVQAITEGRKTVTRRVVKPQPRLQNPLELKCDGFEQREHEKGTNKWNEVQHNYLGEKFYSYGRTAPYKAGDILYVRETWFKPFGVNKNIYKADNPNVTVVKNVADPIEEIKWKPSIHMPKEIARIFLKVTDVRVERLQDISCLDAISEGVKPAYSEYENCNGLLLGSSFEVDERETIKRFGQLWDSTIKKQSIDKYSWKANPYVWVIEFERVEVENE